MPTALTLCTPPPASRDMPSSPRYACVAVPSQIDSIFVRSLPGSNTDEAKNALEMSPGLPTTVDHTGAWLHPKLVESTHAEPDQVRRPVLPPLIGTPPIENATPDVTWRSSPSRATRRTVI